jgi:FdhE protein
MPSVQLRKARDWDERIRRAQDLSARNSSAAQLLTFYQRIATFQKHVSDELANEQFEMGSVFGLRDSIDIVRVSGYLPTLASVVEESGTPILKETASRLKDLPQKEVFSLFDRFANKVESEDGPEQFFARVCIQPFAERSALGMELKQGFAGHNCPLCNGLPQLAVLRPEGDGGKRFLVCSFCITEWEFRRVLCPTCGEMDYQKLPRYSAEGIPAVRVEACDTCKRYLKSVDMTTEGHAVPIVDEIASASLDLWAIDHGYKKIQLNLMGF